MGTKAAGGCDFRHRLESPPTELALGDKQEKKMYHIGGKTRHTRLRRGNKKKNENEKENTTYMGGKKLQNKKWEKKREGEKKTLGYTPDGSGQGNRG